MNEVGSEPVDDDPVADPNAPDPIDEVRQAAGAVVASLKWLVEATEKVVEDPAAFSQIVDSGRSVVEAFVGGFAAQADPADDDRDQSTAEGGDSPLES